ncbi:MAG: hypothetical protein CM15mP111_4370 [Hyphomicrobiales bacterium]|nr:MAG: hypothetical protein CM15mP111_4370 [Hyphomicrobiales bacterium]
MVIDVHPYDISTGRTSKMGREKLDQLTRLFSERKTCDYYWWGMGIGKEIQAFAAAGAEIIVLKE